MQHHSIPLLLLSVVVVLSLLVANVSATRYYLSCKERQASASDANAGTSPDAPWLTVTRVNGASLLPGDQVSFNRGCRWREQLAPQSGNASGFITYDSYGDSALPKPSLVGSVQRSQAAHWTSIGANLWATPSSIVNDAVNALPENASTFNNGPSVSPWVLYVSPTNNAKALATIDTSVFHSGPGSLKVNITRTGLTSGDFQLILAPFDFTVSRDYRFSFWMRATANGNSVGFTIHKPTSPWTSYARIAHPTFNVTGDSAWHYFSTLLTATTVANVSRLTVYLGCSFPDKTVVWLDDFKLSPVASPPIDTDVGLIIFNGNSAGVKKWHLADLAKQGDFTCVNDSVVVYSVGNPGTHYSEIELALYHHIISAEGGRHHVIYDGLDLRYGGAHGVGGGSVASIRIRNMDISWIGGAKQYSDERTTRFGNGIEFWCGAKDMVVEYNKLWEIYDAALTNQCKGSTDIQGDITWRYNVVWNSEYCFEYWHNDGHTVNVRFENNLCADSGFGWSHAQRPDPSGRHLCFYQFHNVSGMFIRNNIFYRSKQAMTMIWAAYQSYPVNLTEDNNIIYEETDVNGTTTAGSYLIRLDKGLRYKTRAAFRNFTGLDPHSIFADPQFVDAANHDYHLAASSPAIGAALPLPDEPQRDIDGVQFSPSTRDIGPYQFRASSASAKATSFLLLLLLLVLLI